MQYLKPFDCLGAGFMIVDIDALREIEAKCYPGFSQVLQMRYWGIL